MAFVDQRLSSRKTAAIGGVVLVHLAIGYAFVSGLALNMVPFIEHHTILLPLPQPKVPPPRPKVPPKPHEEPTMLKPIVDAPTDPQTKPIDPILKSFPKDPDTTFELPPPTNGLERALQARADRPRWITTDDYPSAAIRDGEEGYVAISVTVGTNGRVSSCTVTGSSGHPLLDEATCRLYAKRAHFIPALGKDGTPIEASHADRVRWQLPAE